MLQYDVHSLHEGEEPGVNREEERFGAKTDLDLTSVCIAGTTIKTTVLFLLLVLLSLCYHRCQQ